MIPTCSARALILASGIGLLGLLVLPRLEYRAVRAAGRRQLAGGGGGRQMQYAQVEEGVYESGVWQPLRVWNGDQVDWGLNFTSVPQVLHVRLATY